MLLGDSYYIPRQVLATTLVVLKDTDFELFNEDLINSPRHVSDIFTCTVYKRQI